MVLAAGGSGLESQNNHGSTVYRVDPQGKGPPPAQSYSDWLDSLVIQRIHICRFFIVFYRLASR